MSCLGIRVGMVGGGAVQHGLNSQLLIDCAGVAREFIEKSHSPYVQFVGLERNYCKVGDPQYALHADTITGPDVDNYLVVVPGEVHHRPEQAPLEGLNC